MITGATITTIVILFVLIVASSVTGKGNSELQNKKNPLTIQVTGDQWWWQIHYMNSDPTLNMVTANEIHIPVGRPVQIAGIERCHPQFLGAEPERQTRLDPISHHERVDRSRSSRSVPRAVRGVLRTAARAHGDLGHR